MRKAFESRPVSTLDAYRAIHREAALSAGQFQPGFEVGLDDAIPQRPLGTAAPVPPGGGVDVLCRRIADRMGLHPGINLVVENKAGAGGLVGAQALAAAPADGSNIGYLHAGP